MVKFVIAFTLLSMISLLTRGQQGDKPNIVLVLADDLGYGDVGCYGGKLVPTPNIDRLASGGVRFTDGYASAATCAPSRLGLMTGTYQQRMGAYSNRTSPIARIPEDHLMMPQMLREAGYRTAHIGKWHINKPVRSVFDEVYNELKGTSDYFPAADGKMGGFRTPAQHGWGQRNGQTYITDLHGQAAANFIKNQSEKQQPFFLYLAFNAPHSPWQAPLELKQKFSHISAEVMQLYAAMVYSLDQNVGKVLKQLEDSGVANNTVVLFISDNGPEWGRDYPAFNWPKKWPDTIVGSAGPLSGRKAEFLEGGIRVPFIIRWPEKLASNMVYSRPVSTLDLYETFRVISNGPESKTDGVDLIPHLTGKQANDPHKILFWQGGENRPVYARMGDWKLTAPLDTTAPSLFNLTKDIAEKQDIAIQNPEITKEMLGLVEEWKLDIRNVK